MDYGIPAPHELKIQMSYVDRMFYHERQLTVLACKALIADSVRINQRQRKTPGKKAAQPGRVERVSGRGRYLVA